MIGSPQDLLMIGVVGFVLFGSKKLPEMAKSLGTAIVEFKKVVNQVEEPAKTATAEPEAAKAPAENPAAPEAEPSKKA